jgi:hypothetical protein
MSDLFEIRGDIAKEVGEQVIVVEGDTTSVKYIGSSMSSGKIIVEGNAGMHLGSRMTGGEIHVKGSVDNWVGAEMSGGYIRINKDAGDRLGSAYRGSPEGMTGGVIVVDGNVGKNAEPSTPRNDRHPRNRSNLQVPMNGGQSSPSAIYRKDWARVQRGTEDLLLVSEASSRCYLRIFTIPPTSPSS